MQAVGRIEHGGFGLLDGNGKAFVASDDMLKGGGGKGLCQMKARARGVRLLPWQAVPDKAVRGGKDACFYCVAKKLFYMVKGGIGYRAVADPDQPPSLVE